MSVSSSKVIAPEDRLLDYALRLSHHRAGQRAVFVRVSALVPAQKPNQHWRLVEHLFAPLIRRHGGELFALRRGDAVVVLRSCDRALADRVTQKLHTLFRDDPLLENTKDRSKTGFCTWFELGSEYDAFLALTRRVRENADEPTPNAPPQRQPAEHPDTIETALKNPLLAWVSAPLRGEAGLSALASATVILSRRAGAAVEAVGSLVTARPDVIAGFGVPAGDLERNPELSAALAVLVEERILSELGQTRPERGMQVVASRLAILLGATFQTFHAHWSPSGRAPLVFVVPWDEAEADPAAYRYTRDFVAQTGHALGLSNLSLDRFAEANLARFSPRLVVVTWQAHRAGTEVGSFGRKIAAAIAALGPDRVLLDGLDRREALAFAESVGCTLLAGPKAEALLADKS